MNRNYCRVAYIYDVGTACACAYLLVHNSYSSTYTYDSRIRSDNITSISHHAAAGMRRTTGRALDNDDVGITDSNGKIGTIIATCG